MCYPGGGQQSAGAVLLPIPASGLSWRLKIFFLGGLHCAVAGGRRRLL